MIKSCSFDNALKKIIITIWALVVVNLYSDPPIITRF